jgi:hypothetical protein
MILNGTKNAEIKDSTNKLERNFCFLFIKEVFVSNERVSTLLEYSHVLVTDARLLL